MTQKANPVTLILYSSPKGRYHHPLNLLNLLNPLNLHTAGVSHQPSHRRCVHSSLLERRHHADVSGQQFFINVSMHLFHGGPFSNGFPVSAAGAVTLDFTVVVIAGHGKGLDPFVGDVHADLVNDGGEVLVFPGVGNADPEGGVAVFIGNGVFFYVIGASVETDAFFFINDEPLGVGKTGKGIFHVVAVQVHAEGMGHQGAPVLGVVAVGEIVGNGAFGIQGFHFRDPVGPMVFVEFNIGNGVALFGFGFDGQGRAKAAVHVGVRIHQSGIGVLEGDPVFRQCGFPAHHKAGSKYGC